MSFYQIFDSLTASDAVNLHDDRDDNRISIEVHEHDIRTKHEAPHKEER